MRGEEHTLRTAAEEPPACGEWHVPRNRLAGIGDEAALGLDAQIAAVRRLGWTALELRTVDGVAMADLGPGAFHEVAARLSDAGLDVPCLASRIGNWSRPVTGPFDDDLAELHALVRQCHELGCRYVRIMSYPDGGLTEPEWAARAVDRVARLAAVAEEAGITLLHENCTGWAGDRADRVLRLLREVDSPALRLLFDTGNGLAHGYDALDLLRRILPHVAHVHVKDAVRTPAGTVVYTLPGDGRARIADCLRLLLASGYSGALSLEPHLAVRPHEAHRMQGDTATLFVRAGERLGRILAGLAPHSPDGAAATAVPEGGRA